MPVDWMPASRQERDEGESRILLIHEGERMDYQTGKRTLGKIDRRDFLKALAASGGAAALGTFLAGCAPSLTTGSGAGSGSGITLDLTKPENQSLAAVGGALALDANNLDPQGLLLYRLNENTVLAFSRKCPHMGCVVGEFQGGLAACPCHGSQFDTNGKVVKGPAPSPLKSYSAALSGSTVTVGG
jgi:cytochrome b6-f complex iron-sulfur subunit